MPITHGTISGYSHYKCKCFECTKAKSAHLALTKAIRVDKVRRGVLPVPHGTRNGYINYDCRCVECTTAQREYDQARKAKEN